MIPINIAITGHRDLAEDEIPLYKEKIKTIIKDLQSKYPYSEIQVLSGMAEGADIVGARAALETGCTLVAVLPMEKGDFIKTFYPEKLNKSVKEFNEVLSLAHKVIDLSKIYRTKKTQTDEFVQLGVYLMENSQMIIALWNGVFSDSPGGTSCVIKFALEGMPRNYRKRYSIVDSDDTIPVHFINVERVKNNKGIKQSNYIEKDRGDYVTLYPSLWDGSDMEHIESYYKKQLKEIDNFNKNSCKYENAKSYLKGADDTDINSVKGMDNIINAQKTADCMAGRGQKQTVRLIVTQLLFGFFVFFWVALFDEITPFEPYILILSPIFFLLCVLTFNYANKRCIEERYYDYRALAECLRVQFYWKAVGINENAYSSYSRKNKFELGWVIAAARNVSMDINYELALLGDNNPDYSKIREYWMVNQLDYFRKKNNDNAKVISKNKIKMYILFGAGLIFVIFLIIERLYISGYYDSEYIMHILLFLIDASLAGGAVFSGYLDRRQFEVELKQYSRMVMIFTQGIKEFDSVYVEGEVKDTNETIIEIGADALAENADWVVYNRMSSIDIPIG